MIKKNGFLSSDMESWKAKHKSDNKKIFQLCEEINEISHETMLSMKVTPSDPAEIISACSLVRAMSNFQSIVILCELGLINEAKIILRCLVEAMFLMKAIAKDHDFSSKILDQNLLDDLKTARKVKIIIERKIINTTQCPTLKEVNQKISDLKKLIKDKGITKMQKINLANAAGLTDYYDTIYHILSGIVHINPKDLGQYLDLDKQGNVKEIKWGPDIDGTKEVLFAALELMVGVLESIASLFKLKFGNRWDKPYEEYKSFGELLSK